MTERADAARNRAAVLEATRDLFQREDLDNVTLERVARAAGVGKATVLRRFGDLLGLIQAVVADRATELQERISNGPPPLGPGEEDSQTHLHAYLDALFDHVLENRKLLRALAIHGPHAYYTNPATQFWIDELTRRIEAARPGTDAGYLAHAVFTAMRPDIIDCLQRYRHMDTDRIRAGLHTLADPRETPGLSRRGA